MKKSKLTRRQMLLKSAGALAGVTLTTSCANSVEPLVAERSSRGFKIGACDWTLGKKGDPASFGVAKELGLDGVQISLGRSIKTMVTLNPNMQKTFLSAAKKNNIEIASLAISALNRVPYKSEPQAEEWVDQSIDVAEAMGLKVILLAFFAKGDLLDENRKLDKKGVDVVVRRLRKVAGKAEKAGVILGIESWLSAEQHMDIIDRVGSPAVQVYYDVANSHKAGYDIYKEIRWLGNEHICEFHAKDYDNLYGKGSIDFKQVRRAMDDIGYRGWLQIEGTEYPLGVKESLLYDVKYLRTIFPKTV